MAIALMVVPVWLGLVVPNALAVSPSVVIEHMLHPVLFDQHQHGADPQAEVKHMRIRDGAAGLAGADVGADRSVFHLRRAALAGRTRKKTGPEEPVFTRSHRLQ